jgi:hypothetical protein
LTATGQLSGQVMPSTVSTTSEYWSGSSDMYVDGCVNANVDESATSNQTAQESSFTDDSSNDSQF